MKQLKSSCSGRKTDLLGSISSEVRLLLPKYRGLYTQVRKMSLSMSNQTYITTQKTGTIQVLLVVLTKSISSCFSAAIFQNCTIEYSAIKPYQSIRCITSRRMSTSTCSGFFRKLKMASYKPGKS